MKLKKKNNIKPDLLCVNHAYVNALKACCHSVISTKENCLKFSYLGKCVAYTPKLDLKTYFEILQLIDNYIYDKYLR